MTNKTTTNHNKTQKRTKTQMMTNVYKTHPFGMIL